LSSDTFTRILFQHSKTYTNVTNGWTDRKNCYCIYLVPHFAETPCSKCSHVLHFCLLALLMFKIILQFFVCGITPLKAKVCHVVRKQMNVETTFLPIFKVSLITMQFALFIHII